MNSDGNHPIMGPVHTGQLLTLLRTLEPLDEPVPDIDEDLPPLNEPFDQA